VYRVSPTLPLQTCRFGNWTAGGGLTWPSHGLYRRRNNVEGHIIQAAQLKVTESLLDMRYIKFTRLLHEKEGLEGIDNPGHSPKCKGDLYYM